MLEIKDLTVSVEDKKILDNFSINIGKGEVHAIMGPNGTGKSTLSKVILGSDEYKVLYGDILFEGKSIKSLETDERAKLGIFLSMQNPISIDGISNSEFIKTALNERRDTPIGLYEFIKKVEDISSSLSISKENIHRNVNVGASGGERKKNEIFQMRMLEPKFIILDELDSGLDIDSLKIVCKNINKYLKMILEKYYDKEIVSSLLETYINVRYYNYYEAKCKSQEANINYYMKLKTIELTNNQTEKFIFKTKTTFYLFKYILYFDNVSKYDDLKEKINEIEKYRQNTLELEKSSFIDDMLKLVKENEKRKQKYLESFKSNHFEIKIEQTNKKKVYNVYLTNTIKFNKIYSNYSINKVYTNGIVNEQKLFITYYQITKQILENAIEGIFEKEYIVAFPCSILEKEQKD